MFTAIALGTEEICGFLIGPSCGHPYDPWKQNWTVTFPDVPKPSPNLPDVPKVSYQLSLEYTYINKQGGDIHSTTRPHTTIFTHGQILTESLTENFYHDIMLLLLLKTDLLDL